ncbi:MAG: ketoacyl-synthetase C-terminal extension domain-containing protein, partial [Cyanobacteria bacterium J06573_2]
EPKSISYIEAHGTGTALGDPIEIAALTQVFGREKGAEGAEGARGRQKACGIGSVKTNIGHLDTAAGIASLIKAVLALKYKQIPPSLNFEQPNPQIDFDNSPFYVSKSLSAWETDKLPRRAGVSSFGIGGTNAHVVLEENLTPSLRTPLSLLRRGEGEYQTSFSFTAREEGDETPLSLTRRGEGGEVNPCELLLISAKTESALETATKNLASYLETNSNLNLANVAYTLKVDKLRSDDVQILV